MKPSRALAGLDPSPSASVAPSRSSRWGERGRLAMACSPLVLALAFVGAACGGSAPSNPLGSGGATSGGPSSSSGGGSSTTDTASSSTGVCEGAQHALPATPCTPSSPECGSSSSECISLKNNYGASTFALRVAHLTLSKPDTLLGINTDYGNAIRLNFSTCYLNGYGTASWLLQFDTEAGTLKVGGALRAKDPAAGYSFLDKTIGTIHVAPITVAAPLGASCILDTVPATDPLVLPLYSDPFGDNVTFVPIQRFRLSSARVSADHNCIGTFNAAGLLAGNNCFETSDHPDFLDDGQIDGSIDLEAADKITTGNGKSLCVVLSGDPATYATGTKCKRDANNKILFPGDWCASKVQPASDTCHDAVLFSGTFAASGVTINP